MANVRVAHLPQSRISSLIRRPIVPTPSSTKAIKRVYSRMDIPPEFLLYTIPYAVFHHSLQITEFDILNYVIKNLEKTLYSTLSNLLLAAPHIGHTQPSGSPSNGVPGFMSLSGSPSSGS